jgi:phosphoribosylglycinamide formyltransferase-1
MRKDQSMGRGIFGMMRGRTVVSFLVSGRGLNFSAVAGNILSGKIKARLGIVISDKRNAGVLPIADKFGMKAFFLNPANYRNKRDYEQEMVRLFKGVKTDLIVAAGYMRILSPYFVNIYKKRIINIHPSLLPSFPGVNGQMMALEHGVKITGCTSHFIDDGMDSGPIILQSAVPVLGSDTIDSLSVRILKEEFKLLSESVRLFCEGRLRVTGRRVIIKK